MAKRHSPYFKDFIEMIAFSVQAAEHLQSVLANFDPATLPEQRKAMHAIEHAADEVKHCLTRRLVKEFVTPIEREDIIHLAHELDNVTDKIDNILTRMYMYNITEVPPEALAFAGVILRSCKALHAAMAEFPNFQKSTKLMPLIIEVNTLEEEGDAIYIDAVRKLYKTNEDARQVVTWSELFDRLEDCCDACENLADAMEIVAMKNS